MNKAESFQQMGRTQKQLADKISDELGLTIRLGRTFVQRFIELVREDLVQTGRSELRGLGTFAVFVRPERETTHPTTGQPVKIPERRSVRYRTSKDLKDLLNPATPKKGQKGRK